MGFLPLCCCMTLPKPLLLFFHLLLCIIRLVSNLLVRLGVQSSPEDPAPLILFHDSATTIVASMIRTQLPVVRFGSFKRRWCSSGDEGEERCIVCLGHLKAKDEVRELGNCRHAFHRTCIDRWMDVGHFTCPLCRSQLATTSSHA